MGLLDDAIRDHLELKRRGGADPVEIDRLETEALGPVRRQPLEPAGQRSISDAETDDYAVASERASELGEAEYAEYYEEEYYDEAEVDGSEEPFEEDFERSDAGASRNESLPASVDRLTTELPPEHDMERGTRRWRRSRRDRVPPEQAPPTQAEPPTGMEPGDETGEYGVEDSLDAQGGKPVNGPPVDRLPPEEEADVLEETPEFLQDAPEHDRLWFEQRPPRDFEFDD